MNHEKIWLSSPHMGEDEIKFVQEAFETNWISPVGPHIVAFENELASYTSSQHCAALSSGTAAIHLALIILGVERDDEVICASFTFSGSCNPIRYQGAIPVFVDSEPDTWNMDPFLLEEAIKDRLSKGKRPKAIIVVHLYGMPAKMKELLAIADRYQIPVIEDAAEALGSSYFERPAGSFGQLGVYSFNGNKIITTSGGGALVSANKAWIDNAKFLATQARDPAPHYEHTHIGYNYRLSNVCAGIGRGQLRVLDKRVAKRRSIFDFYRKSLEGTGIRFLAEPQGHFANRWLTTLLIDPLKSGFDRETIRIGLERENIESRPLWKPMHQQPVFRNAPSFINGVSDALFRDGLCIPSGSNLRDDQLSRIVEIIAGLRKK